MKAQEKADLFQFLTLADGWVTGLKTNIPTPKFIDSPKPAPECANFTEFYVALKKCTRCSDKKSTHSPVVGPQIPQKTLVMVITMHPSSEQNANENDLLEKMLLSINLDSTKNSRLTSILRCSFNKTDFPDNHEKMHQCLPWLIRETELAQPSAILIFGTDSAEVLFGHAKPNKCTLGDFFTWRGISVIATHHPSQIILEPSLKRPTWEHLKRLRVFLDSLSAEEN